MIISTTDDWWKATSENELYATSAVTPDGDNNVSVVMAIVGSLVLILITLLCVLVFTKTVRRKKRKEEFLLL